MEIQILSLTIALLAVILSPIVTYKPAKKNSEIQFRLSVPIKWVDKLEESAHSFLLATLEWIEKYRALSDKVKTDAANSASVNNEIGGMLNSINSSIIKLELLLDKTQPVQNEILNQVIRFKAFINQKKINVETINQLRKSRDSIVEKVKTVLQEERIKITKLFK